MRENVWGMPNRNHRSPPEVQATRQPVFIDLFAGCGGLSLGLLRAGWKGLFALEKDSFAFETLKTNLIEGIHGPRYSWPAWVPKEPSEVGFFIEEHRDEIKRLRGKVDLIAGGPPCQGFSLAGRRKRDDRRNRSIKHYFEFIRLVRPAVLLIENVRVIAVEFGKKRRASENRNRVGRPARPFSVRIQKELEDSGYRVYSDIIRAMDFGVPQFRPRFIMIGIHEDHLKGALADPFELLSTRRSDFLSAKGLPKASVTVADAISDLEISGVKGGEKVSHHGGVKGDHRGGAKRRLGRRAKPARRAVLFFGRERNRGGGKVGNLVLVFHFSIRLRRRSCGNVEISPVFGEISKGLVGRVGSRLWLSTLSTAPAFPQLSSFWLRQRWLAGVPGGGVVIADPGLSSSYCSLIDSSLHSSPGCEHGESSGPAKRRSDVLTPAPQSIRRTADCW
jgi:DNA-cytosine methyltransferase